MGSSVSVAMKFAHLIFASFVFALVLHQVAAKRRGGASSSSSSSYASSPSRSSSSSSSSSSPSRSSSSSPTRISTSSSVSSGSKSTSTGTSSKKTGGIGGKAKKAVVIGAVAYGSYKYGKLSSEFSKKKKSKKSYKFDFDDWNDWREVDGFLCRNNSDCNWVDEKLFCQDYELKITPNSAWFGGDVVSIVGECACPIGTYFDDDEMECASRTSSAISNTFSRWGLALAFFMPLF